MKCPPKAHLSEYSVFSKVTLFKKRVGPLGGGALREKVGDWDLTSSRYDKISYPAVCSATLFLR